MKNYTFVLLKKDMLNFEFLQYYLPKTMITKYYLDIYLVLLLHHSFKSDFESTPSWAYPVLNFTGSQWFDRPLQTCGFWQMMWQEVGKCVQNQRFHGSDFINIFGHQFLWILWNTVSRIHNLWAMALPIHVVVMQISYFNDHLILWISSTTKVGA